MKNLYFGILILLTHSLSQAAVITSIDLNNTGDNLITVDNDQNLLWLDLTVTLNTSFQDYYDQSISGGTLYGWRFATETEVKGLMSQFNLPLIDEQWAQLVNYSEIQEAKRFLGNTEQNCVAVNFGGECSDSGFKGAVYNPNDPNRGYLMYAYSNTRYDEQTIRLESPTLFYGDMLNSGYENTGIFLVQDIAAVPIPAASWLFGSALLGLLAFKRKKPIHVLLT